jgi:mannose/fructose/N-acetylgalactosamine-specific phosphotransferase system component IIC
VSARSWGLAVVGVVVLCLAIGFSLAFQLDFVLVGIMVVAALVATYIAGRMDKRKQRGPWAKENSDG